jgi:hypothetical protein
MLQCAHVQPQVRAEFACQHQIRRRVWSHERTSTPRYGPPQAYESELRKSWQHVHVWLVMWREGKHNPKISALDPLVCGDALAASPTAPAGATSGVTSRLPCSIMVASGASRPVLGRLGASTTVESEPNCWISRSISLVDQC